MTTDALRERLQSDIGRRIREDVWQELARRGVVALARKNPAAAYGKLLSEYQEIDASFPTGAPKRPLQSRERTTPPDARLEGLSRLLAERAARDPAAQAFRRDVLGGRLVEWDDLESWISARAPKPGEPTLAIFTQRRYATDVQAEALMKLGLSERLARLASLAESEPIADDPDHVGWERLRLRYMRRDGSSGGVPVPTYGPLLSLHRLVRRLAVDDVGPQPLAEAGPEWATTWALCGVTPFIPRIRVSVTGHGMPSLWRISLDANWRASAEEVSREYNWARGPNPGRDKPMKERGIALALLADRWRGEDGSWPDRRGEWNARCDGQAQPRSWRFRVKDDPYAKSFSNQARASWRRLTGSETWGGKR